MAKTPADKPARKPAARTRKAPARAAAPAKAPTPAKAPAKAKPATTPAAKPRTAARPKPAAATPRAAPAPASTAKRARSIASIGALVLGAGAGIVALVRRLTRPGQGTVPTDLMRADHPGPDDRAIDAFRPDPTAPVPASEREALRPALATPDSPNNGILVTH